MAAWARTSSTSCRLHLLLVMVVVAVEGSGAGVFPAWQQYFPPRKWAFYDEQVHGRPGRVRVGRGRYRLGPGGAELAWDFPPHLKLVWAFYDEQVHGRPGRVRVGRGRYRLGPGGAELACDFPPHLKLVSNVVWERADLGDSNSLNQIYRRFGVSHEFTMQYHPTGSTLHILNPGPLDKGLYRCLASAIDLSSPLRHSMSVFQDVDFFPHL